MEKVALPSVEVKTETPVLREPDEGNADAENTGSSRERKRDSGRNLFALRHELQLYDFVQARVTECDVEIEAAIGELNHDRTAPDEPIPRVRHASGKNEPKFDVRGALYTPSCAKTRPF